jgi:hypothetical protein
VTAFLCEKLHSQRFLDQLDLVADRRMGQAQLGGGVADRLMARRRLKPLERLERRQAPKLDLALNGPALPVLAVGTSIPVRA